jgi:hypothetical protein
MTSDQIQLQSSGTPLVSLRALGTLNGVEITAVAALNGPGQGLLSIDAASNLSWTPPGGAVGTPVDVSAGGNFIIYDSTGNAWIGITVAAAYLALASAATVTLEDLYDGPIVSDDVTAVEASAGDVATWSIAVKNTSGVSATGLVAWLDPATYSGIDISLDGVTWSAPTSEGAGLSIGTLAASASATIYFQRTVPSSSASLASGLVLLNVGWTGPTAGQTAARGLFRIFNDAIYRLYYQSSPAAPGSTPDATSSTLPYSVSLADGTWYLSASYFNGVYDSGFLPLGAAARPYQIVTLVGGVVIASPPPAPLSLELAETAPGVVTVTATATDPGNVGDLWYLTTNVTPATYTKSVSAGALAIFRYSLPAVSAGTMVNITLCLQNSGGSNSAAITASITTASGGPTAPLQAIVANPISDEG